MLIMHNIYKFIFGVYVSLLSLCPIMSVRAKVFTIKVIPEKLKEAIKSKKIWNEKCPVGLARLRVINFSYYGFDSQRHDDGTMIVLDAVAEDVVHIFKELYRLKFPIAKASTIDKYNGDDEASMADNNTTCFHCREITGGGLPSIHAYGLAIDINPIQNPFITWQEPEIATYSSVKVMPGVGVKYLNRTNVRVGMVETPDIIAIFKKHGFKIWGGEWNNPIDLHHFQPSRATAQLLAVMSPCDAKLLFKMYVRECKLLNAIDAKDNQLILLYQKNPTQFMQLLKDQPSILAMEPHEAYLLMGNVIKVTKKISNKL